MCEISLKLTITTPERRQRRSGVIIVNFEHISHFFLVFLLLTLNKLILAVYKLSSAFTYYSAFASPSDIYLFKVNEIDIRKISKICLKLTTKTF